MTPTEVPIMSFTNGLPTSDYVPSPTSAARLELLAGLARFLMGCAATPYMAQAVMFDRGATLPRVYVCQRFNVGTIAAQARYSKAARPNVTTNNNATVVISAFGETSGGGANDEIQTPSPWQRGTTADQTYPFTHIKIVESSASDVPAPVAIQDRLFEIPAQLTPRSEKFKLKDCHGFSAIPIHAANLVGL